MDCKNIVLGVVDVRVAPYNATTPATLEDAVSIGLTDGGTTLTRADEKAVVNVDQVLGPVRHITTAATFTGSANVAEINLANIAKAFNTSETITGTAPTQTLNLDAVSEKYYTLFLVGKGEIDAASGKPVDRVYTFLKVSFNGTGAITFSKTEKQVLPLEWTCLMSCDTQTFGSVADAAPAN
jgi:hypothetical protein